MPAQVLEKLKPGLVTPAVLFLVSQDAPTGEIIEAGAGWYTRVQVYQGQGAIIGDKATAEDIANNWDKISDMSQARAYATGSEAFAGALKF